MRPPRILIVEDEVIVSMALSMKLAAWGYEVVGTERSGLGAIRAFDRTSPDIAVLDIFLADSLDGIDVARHIRQKGPTPFIFVTASQDKETAERAGAMDPAAILPKPYFDAVLRSTLDRILDGRLGLRATETASWIPPR